MTASRAAWSIRIATRKSALALAQTRLVASWLKALDPSVEIEEVHVVTMGDRVQDVPLSEVGGKGLFVTELEKKLQDGEADLAVHSLKDVPAELAAGLAIAATPKREDPRDALLTADGRGLDALPAGAVVGTSSLRRKCQLLAIRPDLDVQPLRGNVDTRIRKLREGQYQAIVLAMAGMRRLGIEAAHVPLDEVLVVPAVGQGSLALETRGDSGAAMLLAARLDDDATRLEVEAERTLLGALGGSCQLPIAGHARYDAAGRRLHLRGLVAAPDGSQRVRAERWVELPEGAPAIGRAAAHALGLDLADDLLAQGARGFVEAAAKLVGGPHLPAPRRV